MAVTLPRPRSSAPSSASESREERKYPLPDARAALLTAWLDARLPRDPQYPLGVNTSCYYDTAQLDAYQESVDGEFAKQKLRLRWYGDPIDPYAGVWIELKSRAGASSQKFRARYSITGLANPLGLVLPDRPELARCLRDMSELATSLLDPTLEPAAFIRYQRIRWESPDGLMRASLDTQVRAANPRGAPIWLPVPHGSVLELKSTGELPQQIAHLGKLGLRRTAHSKYALAIELLYGGERTHIR